MKVAIQAGAGKDIQNCAKFWEKKCPGLGQEFIEFILFEVDKLERVAGIHPNSGRHYRMVVQGRFPYYSIFYRITGDTTEAIAIVDTRRDPEWIAAFLKRRLD